MPDTVAIQVDGRTVEAERGATVAAALWNAGRTTFRRSLTGEARGPLCAMGICFECRVTINGIRDRRACVEIVSHGLDVRIGG